MDEYQFATALLRRMHNTNESHWPDLVKNNAGSVFELLERLERDGLLPKDVVV